MTRSRSHSKCKEGVLGAVRTGEFFWKNTRWGRDLLIVTMVARKSALLFCRERSSDSELVPTLDACPTRHGRNAAQRLQPTQSTSPQPAYRVRITDVLDAARFVCWCISRARKAEEDATMDQGVLEEDIQNIHQ